MAGKEGFIMKIRDIAPEVTDEEKASKKLCKSSIPNSKLGTSQVASCKAQGLRPREGKKRVRLGGKVVGVAGKKIKGVRYGGPVKNYD